jgi:hypothetical protein
MAPVESSDGGAASVFEEMMRALAGRQGEMELRLDRVKVRLPLLREHVEVSGSITITAHVRDLSDKERGAYASRTVSRVRS